MGNFVVWVQITVEHEDDLEELDRMLLRAPCITDYEYTSTVELTEEGEPIGEQQ